MNTCPVCTRPHLRTSKILKVCVEQFKRMSPHVKSIVIARTESETHKSQLHPNVNVDDLKVVAKV